MDETVPAMPTSPGAPVFEPSTIADADLWDAAKEFAGEYQSWPSLHALGNALTAWAKQKGFVA